jgi:hypothetical protein
MSPVCKMADNGWLNVDQKGKVVLLCVMFTINGMTYRAPPCRYLCERQKQKNAMILIRNSHKYCGHNILLMKLVGNFRVS